MLEKFILGKKHKLSAFFISYFVCNWCVIFYPSPKHFQIVRLNFLMNIAWKSELQKPENELLKICV